MRRLAADWSRAENRTITARQAALRLAQMKLGREVHRHERDNLMDCAGYLLIAALCAEVDEEERGQDS